MAMILSMIAFIPGLKTPHAQAAWYSSSWNYRQKIILDHNKVPNTDQSNFPVLIKITDTSNPLFDRAQSSGNDILFTDATETTKLSHEIETFSTSSHELWAWVKIPTLSYTTDTVIYLYYGNPSCSSQQTATDVWSNGYAGVWHMNNASSPALDSTSNANNGTQSGGVTFGVTSKVDGGTSYNGSNYLDLANADTLSPGTGVFTLQAWVKTSASGNALVYSDYGIGSVKFLAIQMVSNKAWGGCRDGSGNNLFIANQGSNINDGAWHKVAYVRDAQTTAKLYLDGSQIGSASNGSIGSVAIADGDTPRVSALAGTPSDYLNGSVDDLAYASTARSADWIATEYANQNSPETFYNISAEVGKDNYSYQSMPAGWYSTSWNKRQPITLNPTFDKVPNTSQTDFPVLVKFTDAGNELWANAQADGDDILFADTSGNKLAHEIEKYDNATHELWAWVKIPTLATGDDTHIYMYYGNSAASSQQSVTSVWDNNYKGVWHLGEAGTNPTTYDSTNNNNDSISQTWTPNTSGIIGSNASFNGAQVISMTSSASLQSWATGMTYSAWIKRSTADTNERGIIVNGNTNSNGLAMELVNGVLTFWVSGIGGLHTGTAIMDTNWHHVVGIFNDTNNYISIYQDGVITLNQQLETHSVVTPTTNFVIGDKGQGGAKFAGLIDEARVSSGIFTADWIATEYNNQNSPSTFETFGAGEVGDSFAPSNPSAITALYSEGGSPILLSSGTDSTPYYSWPEAEATGGASDQTGANVSGVAGYYSYFGTSCGDGGADPALTRGVLSDTGSGLHYSSSTNVSVPDLTTNEGTYCLRLKTRDNAGNTSSSAWQAATYKFDLQNPNAPTFIAANPAGYSAVNSFAFTWPAASDNGVSGLAGYQYKRGGSSGDSWSATQAGTSVSAILSYQTGENIFLVRSIDNAGNTSAEVQTTYYYSNSAPTKPTSLTSDPDMYSATNSWSFSWTAPVHALDIDEYGYSINAYPTAQNLTWTGSNATTLAQDAYATVQGDNTFYLVAKDDSGAYALDAANVASLTFNTQTVAPPIPLNPTIADSSNRAYSTYSLTIKWSTGEGQDVQTFDHYLVERSANGTDFSSLATTTSTAYIDVSGLSNSTTYYYRIKSVDNADSTSAASTIVSRIPTGKYDSPPTILQGPSDSNIKATEATITWVTNRASTGGVRFGTSEADLDRSQIDPTEETEHSITIPGLEGNTKYYYQVQSLDNDRDYASDSAYSATASFTTLSLPSISDVKISNITLNTAELSWSTSTASNANLSYGKTISYGSSWSDTTSFTTNHTYKLTNLDHTTSYHFKITGEDEDGNSIVSDDYVFDTLPMPKISSVNFETDLTGTSPKSYITWTTNVATTSSVDYTPKNGTATYEESQSAYVTAHKVELSKLTDNTSYSFYVSGTDGFGNKAISDEFSFATPFDSRAAVISDVLVETSNIGLNQEDKAQIVVSWNTDEPATSLVEYSEGLTGDQYTQKTTEDKNLSSSHLVIISDLKPNTPYHFKVVSRDKGTNLSESSDQSIIAGDVPKSILNIIVDTFENVFGWIGKMI